MGDIADYAPLVRKYTWNKSEDAKAKAWLAVVEAFATYDPSKGVPLPGYVESKVKYAIWNMLKKEQRNLRCELYVDFEDSLIQNLPDSTDVAAIVEAKFLRKELRRALCKLSFKQRQAVTKTIIYGYSLTELAREWAITPQAVFNLRKCGLASLKKQVSGMY